MRGRGRTEEVDPVSRFIVYRPVDRPDVEVWLEGRWWPGELRMWRQDDDGSWRGNVQWHRAAGSTFLDTFPADRIRRV
jgi:hypothetical protein